MRLLPALLVSSFCCGLFAVPTASAATEVVRPMIWVTPADRVPILAKTEAQPWAKAAFNAMTNRVKDAVAQHQASPEVFLRGLPLVEDKAHPQLHPTLALIHRGGSSGDESEGNTRGKLQEYLQIGIDCGVLYFLTQDEACARCAADILNATVEAMVQMKPSAGDGKTGSIKSVTAMGDENNFAGFKVVSWVDGQSLTQYVLVQPTATSVYENPALGISFRGRYAVISVDERGACTTLYLGEGERLRFQGYDLHTQAETSTAASATIDGDIAKVTANAPTELALPSGQRIKSNPPITL